MVWLTSASRSGIQYYRGEFWYINSTCRNFPTRETDNIMKANVRQFLKFVENVRQI